ncbi:MAG: 30S ribosomal protein S9 [Ignisphaera sp.]|jgi:small subunit ribosomal protein S9|nr:30S ribosomal protein S9 [Ignisphaera sp.]MCC6055286.1 30S ribosomal protein S9 [Desulfurococcaceae archaeon]
MSQQEAELKVLGAYPQIISGKKYVLSYGKRKTAVARAVITHGRGLYRVNGVPVELYPIELARQKMLEPLLLLSEELRNSIDINVSVQGGGVMAQAYAVRTAVARGIVMFFENPVIKRLFNEYDRTMLAGDPRRTEPEKWMRYSARRFRQKSYR